MQRLCVVVVKCTCRPLRRGLICVNSLPKLLVDRVSFVTVNTHELSRCEGRSDRPSWGSKEGSEASRRPPRNHRMWVLGLLLPVLLLMQGQGSWGACVEVDSDTEAVANESFKLGCICCKMRAEIPANASVEWFFEAPQDRTISKIYRYKENVTLDARFTGRLAWNGSKPRYDLQDGSIFIYNVTFNDTGNYRCEIKRTLSFRNHTIPTNCVKNITLTVVAKPTRPEASIISEVMMYVSIIGLQLWLLVEMIYCYGKISSASIGEAQRESTAEYIAASPTQKNSEDLQVAE